MTTATMSAPPRADDEYKLQCRIAQHVRRYILPGVWWTAVPMGERRTPNAGLRVKNMGGRKGAPDLIFLSRSVFLAIELKKDIYEVPSPDQIDCRTEIVIAGGFHRVLSKFEDAVRALEEFHITKPSPAWSGGVL